MNTSAAATTTTTTTSFVAAVSAAATKVDHANLSAAAGVLIIIRNAGGTNKKAASALWALLPESVVNTFQQVKRINGALNAATDKASDGANTVRPLWLAAKTAKALTDSLLVIGITSPRSLLDLVAPRSDKKESVKKTAVETFMQATKVEGFNEDVTPILVFIAERHAKAMQDLLNQAQAFQAGVLKDAADKNAAIEAKAKKAKATKDAKAARDAERTRLNAEKTAAIEKLMSEEKSAQAKQDHAEKMARERATHPKKREIIEA